MGGFKDNYFNGLVEYCTDNSSTLENSNIWSISTDSELVKKLDKFIMANLKSNDYTTKYFYTKLINSLPNDKVELIVLSLLRELYLSLSFNKDNLSKKVEVAISLTKQLIGIIDESSFGMLKALVLIKLTELKAELDRIGEIREFTNNIILIKGDDSENRLGLSERLLNIKVI